MNYGTKSDQELLGLFKEGRDPDAFAEIYNRFWEVMYDTGYAVIREEGAAKDIVQEVFIGLWQRDILPDIQSLKPYLQQAVRFQVFKMLRQSKTDKEFYKRLAAVTHDIIAENSLFYKEMQATVQHLLHRLPEEYGETFRLSREEGLTYKQIAQQLNISEKTVEKRLSKCLKFLRASMDRNLFLLAFSAGLILFY